MAESLTLTTPIAQPSITAYHLIQLNMNIELQNVFMAARSDIGTVVTRSVDGAVAVNLMHTLNTANLSVKSLQRRALEYMAAQGDFAGSVSGTPD